MPMHDLLQGVFSERCNRVTWYSLQFEVGENYRSYFVLYCLYGLTLAINR